MKVDILDGEKTNMGTSQQKIAVTSKPQMKLHKAMPGGSARTMEWMSILTEKKAPLTHKNIPKKASIGLLSHELRKYSGIAVTVCSYPVPELQLNKPTGPYILPQGVSIQGNN